ncbi:2OG-Fe dioxygenase family protein [Actinosynnema sp. ALI-1.44]|uniref:2OG-Fe dioxygenase family protein n=1 Tax=Actinosynnema sp. ALI-1.44 TaxID=1933779 RepID=UPI00192D098F|nr:2OG-Fe dioxygenase family protein [Actinosynnema sp. ALI-1.44]
MDDQLRSLTAEFEQLPVDPYSSGDGRYRRFGRGILLPWNGEFMWMPETVADMPDGTTAGLNDYRQGEHNPEFSGVVRHMPGLTDAIRRNSLLSRLIQFDFAQTTWTEADSCWPVHVGVHLLKLSVDKPDGRAVASPDMLHQDGEPYTFAHLIYRRDAEGGENVIAAPEHAGSRPDALAAQDILDQFVLRQPLDSYGVKDDLVSHYVAPVTVAPGAAMAERAILLIDFTPMTQRV